MSIDAAIEKAAIGLGYNFVGFDNTDATPIDGDYIEVFRLSADSEAYSIGIGGQNRIEGIHQISLYTKKGTGRPDSDRITSALVGKQFTSGDSTVHVFGCNVNPPIDAESHILTPISVRWFSHQQRS